MKTLFPVKKHNLSKKILVDKFLAPPFSVFNTHQPYWRNRMIYWRDLGFCGTNGRVTSNNGLSYDNRRMDKYAGNRKNFNGTSTFSPVLCEIIYKWFTAGKSNIYDPFAGGITRGGIAAVLGHNYIGYDINEKQIESNYDEYRELENRYLMEGGVVWATGCCLDFPVVQNYDLVFTCPPYYNLEKYSDDPDDLSNVDTYEDFLLRYELILSRCFNVLKDDSFCVYVVSDVRDKNTTEYYGLVADTVKLGQSVGFKFYNEIILYNDTGNLAIVSGDYLNRARKVGRQHQNVLVFYKGDPKNIRDKFGDVVIGG